MKKSYTAFLFRIQSPQSSGTIINTFAISTVHTTFTYHKNITANKSDHRQYMLNKRPVL